MRFQLSHQLYEQYLAFVNDSAIYYLEQCINIAKAMDNQALEGKVRAELAFQCSNTGMYDEALFTLDSIKPALLERDGLGAYYKACNHVYGEMAFYTRFEPLRERYRKKAADYEQLLYEVLDSTDLRLFQRQEMTWMDKGDLDKSLAINDKWMENVPHGSHAKEPVILGYELMNEPIAHYFENKDELNARLEPLYKRAVKAIRQVDRNHVILLGGARWNSDFFMFSDWTFDNNIMYTCHRYGGDATAEAINDYISFRDKTQLPMYMGEIGHNTNEWQADFVKVMKQANIGYTFWPYKKLDGSCMMGIQRPELWDSVVVKYSETDRTTYKNLREARPNQQLFRQQLDEFIRNCRFERCHKQEEYIRSLGMTPRQ